MVKYISDFEADKLGRLSGVSFQAEYEPEEKRKILAYLSGFKPCAFTTAPVEDHFTGEEVRETDFGYSDGEYRWYECEIYCLEKYDLALTEEFREYVKRKTETK